MSKLPDAANNFDEYISNGVVVVDFWAPWCGPCKMLAPVLDDVAAKYSNVKFGQVNVDNAIELAKKYRIVSIPNLCFFKDGELVDQIIGLCDEDEISDTINKYL